MIPGMTTTEIRTATRPACPAWCTTNHATQRADEWTCYGATLDVDLDTYSQGAVHIQPGRVSFEGQESDGSWAWGTDQANVYLEMPMPCTLLSLDEVRAFGQALIAAADTIDQE